MNANRLPNAWDRFWFGSTMSQPRPGLRIWTGAAACVWFAGWLWDSERWLQPVAQLTAATISSLALEPATPLLVSNLSYQLVPWIGMAAVALWTFRLLPLLTGPLALASLLAIFHRTSWVCGPAPAVLAMLLLYQCLGEGRNAPPWRRNLSMRLIQLHLAGLLLFSGLQQFRGLVWWNGEAMPWLLSRSESQLADLTALLQWPWLLQLLTHFCALAPLAAVGAAFTPRRRELGWCMLAYGACMAVATGDVLHYVLLAAAYFLVFGADAAPAAPPASSAAPDAQPAAGAEQGSAA